MWNDTRKLMKRPETELNWDEETLIYVDDLEFLNKELESQLKEIDEDLAFIEDTVKGEEGDIITKIRAKIPNLKN